MTDNKGLIIAGLIGLGALGALMIAKKGNNGQQAASRQIAPTKKLSHASTGPCQSCNNKNNQSIYP